MRSLRFDLRGAPRKQIRMAAAIEALESRQMFSAAPVRFTDDDGDQVTIRLSGVGTLDMDPATRNVATSATNTSSVLTISVKRAVGGDGLVTVGELRCYGPMKALIGPSVTVTREISIDDLQEPVSPSRKVSLNLGVLRDLAVYTGGQRIGTMKLADWSTVNSGQELNAPTVDTLIVTGRKDVPGTEADESLPGNCNAILLLGDASTTAGTWSVRTIRVAGMVGDIQATGRVGNITAGQISGQLKATTFGTITARAVVGSTVATGMINGDIEATGVPGVRTSIGAIRAGSDANSLTVLTDQGDIGQISIRGNAMSDSIVSAGGIGGIDVAGSFGASRIQSFGNVGHVRVGEIGDSTIQVGVAPTFDGTATTAADFANPAARLGSFAIAGIKGAPADTTFVSATTLSAARLGTVSLRNANGSEAMQIYVLDDRSPVAVRYVDLADATNSFLWRNGRTEPAMLAEMLHQV